MEMQAIMGRPSYSLEIRLLLSLSALCLLSLGQLRLLPQDALGRVPLVLADEAHHRVEAQVAQAHAARLGAIDLQGFWGGPYTLVELGAEGCLGC